MKDIVTNVAVYGLDESVRASKYPMAVDVDAVDGTYTDTVYRLGNAPIGSGHDNFLNGIVVQFDLTFSLKAWTEMQRYHFIDFVSSQSTMHRIAKFDVEAQCNDYVDATTLFRLQQLVTIYKTNPTEDNYLRILYNIPTGLRLTARMTTNYRQLKTIYAQRKNHRLPEWREFCAWIETLPRFKELCLGGGDVE